jgi:hypothetical protein
MKLDTNYVKINIPDGPYSGDYVAYLDVVTDRLKSGRRHMSAQIADIWPEIWRKGGRDAVRSFPDFVLAVILCQL